MHHPLRSLREGNWFKLICGASFQHLPAIRSLTLAYTLAGVDCIDVAADPAVVFVVREALQAAAALMEGARERGFNAGGVPWLMVSLNDGEDPHFRKAEFNPDVCPEGCLRPCERICPAGAIVFNQADDGFSGVIDSRCYGCGRCLPICPIQQISARSYVSTAVAIAPLVLQGIDAVEIHTQIGRFTEFERLWAAIAPYVAQLKLVAISCPDGEGLIDYLWSLQNLISPLPCPVIWQTDGRPMSGDIGDGATRAAIKLGQKVLAAGLPGYVQLAGGTNSHTVAKLKDLRLLNLKDVVCRESEAQLECASALTKLHAADAAIARSRPYISGVAYGSYARVLLSPVLEQLEKSNMEHPALSAINSGFSSASQSNSSSTSDRLPDMVTAAHLETHPELLWQAVSLADSLVSQIKSPMKQKRLVSS